MINEDEDKCVALEGGAHRSWGRKTSKAGSNSTRKSLSGPHSDGFGVWTFGP